MAINISSSLMAHLFFKGEPLPVCPRNLKRIWIDKEQLSAPTLPMLYGQYGETLCLGATAYSTVDDLPRKALSPKQEKQNRYRQIKGLPLIQGDKSLTHRRIDEQAIRFKQLEKEGVFEVYGTQVKLRMDMGDGFVLGGVLDMFPFTYNDTADGESYFGVGDLKFSETLDQSYVMAKYPWGDFGAMDKTQAFVYLKLVENIDNELNESVVSGLPVRMMDMLDATVFVYTVFEWGSKMRWRPYVVKRTDSDGKEVMETIRRTKGILSHYRDQDWPAMPDVRLCERCSLTDCNERLTTVVWG